MTKRQFPVEKEGEGGWTRWIPASAEGGYQIACCDCGLVHDLQFRVIDGRVEFRASQNTRSSGQLRRQMRKRGDGIFKPK